MKVDGLYGMGTQTQLKGKIIKTSSHSPKTYGRIGKIMVAGEKLRQAEEGRHIHAEP